MINSYIFAILKLIFYYLFIVLKFILLHFLPSITSCLFLCFKKTPLLRSYAASCNFIPIGHGIPLAEKKNHKIVVRSIGKIAFHIFLPVEERHEFIVVITILTVCHHHHHQ